MLITIVIYLLQIYVCAVAVGMIGGVFGLITGVPFNAGTGWEIVGNVAIGAAAGVGMSIYWLRKRWSN